MASMSTTCTDRAGTTKLSNGRREPSSVAKPMSTTADSSCGFVSTSCSLESSAVKPSARYHSDDSWVVHGATDVPAGCVATCSTRPRPPSISTIAPTNGAATEADGSTVDRAYGSTVTGSSTAWPSPASSVTRACIGAGPAFASTNAPALPSAPSAGTPGQNHVLVSAAPDGTDGIHGAGIEANTEGSGAGVSRAAMTNAPAATTDTARTGSRRRIIAPLPPRRTARRPR